MLKLGLAICSGILFAISWPETGGLVLPIFFAFIPLLIVEDELSQKPKSGRTIFGYAFITFLVFNAFTTWWIWFASGPGMCLAIFFNTLFMSLCFRAFSYIKKHLGFSKGMLSLILIWCGFEYLHFNWELSWPWMALGNVFANTPKIVQWYQYTGIGGGTAIIVSINAILFQLHKNKTWKTSLSSWIGIAICIFPLIGSFLTSPQENDPKTAVEVVIVQPNIDPYNEKFGSMTDEQQIDRMIGLAKKEITKKTELVAFPETAFPRGYWIDELPYTYGVIQMQQLIDSFPNLHIIVGLSAYKRYPLSDNAPTISARKLGDDGWYDSYNSALFIHKEGTEIYHKSRLVNGVEKLPYSQYLKHVSKFSIDLGGTTGRLGVQDKATVFTANNGKWKIGPAICYESVYGEYYSTFAKEGASLMAIITNDGWWEDTPGYKQHLAYSRIRAIETQREIARSANTGISAIVRKDGTIDHATSWWKQAVFKGEIFPNEKLSFFSEHGAVIGRVTGFLALLLFLWGFVKSKTRKL